MSADEQALGLEVHDQLRGEIWGRCADILSLVPD